MNFTFSVPRFRALALRPAPSGQADEVSQPPQAQNTPTAPSRTPSPEPSPPTQETVLRPPPRTPSPRPGRQRHSPTPFGTARTSIERERVVRTRPTRAYMPPRRPRPTTRTTLVTRNGSPVRAHYQGPDGASDIAADMIHEGPLHPGSTQQHEQYNRGRAGQSRGRGNTNNGEQDGFGEGDRKNSEAPQESAPQFPTLIMYPNGKREMVYPKP